MERLTKKIDNGRFVTTDAEARSYGETDPEDGFFYNYFTGEAIDKLAAYEDIGSPEEFRAYKETDLTPQEFQESADFVLELNKKLKPYMDAVQQKRCVMFPCAIGETIYFIRGGWANGKLVYQRQTFEIVPVHFDPCLMWDFNNDRFSLHYFLTKQAAQDFITENTDGAVKFL